MPEMPSREEIERWIASEDGHVVNEALHNFNCFHHGTPTGEWGIAWGDAFKDIYANPAALKSLQIRLSGQLPVDDIRHAAYIPEKDLLLLSDEDEWLSPRSILDEKLNKIANFASYHPVHGMTARVRSNRWRIFDTMGVHRDIEYVRTNGAGLAKNGYILLFRDYKKAASDVTHDYVLP
ncbi:MAG: hypothetical protein HY517_01955 [Candidatus Aenigmarchaeota archaeon]|nr:hypothetical protein [Candidatus Aenigmarchaeota archaeon]